MPLRVPFGTFSPDRPPFGNQGSGAALNVVPHAGGYRPFPQMVPYLSALDKRCQGAFFTTDADGNAHGFAGDDTKLYALSGSTAWANATRGVGDEMPDAYVTPATGRWDAARFGDTVLMTNYADEIQAYTLGSDTEFADLAGTPPKAKAIAVISNFVVLGFLDESGTVLPGRIRWSAINNHASWPTPGTDAARIVQADQRDLQGDGGWIQGLVGGLSAANGAILQERALWRMIYTQPPIVFVLDQVEGGRGTPAPGSIAQVGGTIFYLGEDGFYRFDGQSSIPIGDGRVDRTFFRLVDTSFFDRVTAAVDPVNKLVIWAYPASSEDGAPNRQAIYNWQVNEWAEGDAAVEIMVRAMQLGVDLDTDLNADETLADDDTWPSLDSRFWTGGRPGLAGFDGSHRLGFFAGLPRAAKIETGEFEFGTGRASMLTRVRPLIDGNGGGASVTARVRSRYRLGDMPSNGQAYAMTGNGDCHARSTGRYHRVEVEISAGTAWEFAQGVDVDGMEMEGS